MILKAGNNEKEEEEEIGDFITVVRSPVSLSLSLSDKKSTQVIILPTEAADNIG
jgi:hypothetical protein